MQASGLQLLLTEHGAASDQGQLVRLPMRAAGSAAQRRVVEVGAAVAEVVFRCSFTAVQVISSMQQMKEALRTAAVGKVRPDRRTALTCAAAGLRARLNCCGDSVAAAIGVRRAC